MIDDGSTDASAEIARGFGKSVNVYCQANAGIGAARNRGVDEAKSEWITFLDADDVWLPEKLERQWEACRAGSPPADIVMGWMIQFTSPELNDADAARYYCPQAPKAGYHVGTLFMRRARFLEVGFFDLNLKSGEFIEWLMRARAAGLRELVIPDIVMKRRIHGNNYTLQHKDLNKDYLDMVKTILQSRKKP